jgi:hypothetical protein
MNVNEIRGERNRRLQDSDRYVLPDYPHASSEVREKWVLYRQALRDMMANVVIQSQGDPEALLIVHWPASPLRAVAEPPPTGPYVPPPPGGAAPPS